MHSVRVFKSAEELADILAHEITLKINASANPGKPFSIALEGGSTPEMLYSLLAEKYAQLIPWKIVHLYLGDERCVPLTHAESNFGMIKRILINKVKIPDSNIHPAPVEAIAVEAAKLYSGIISSALPVRDKLPVFDLVLLGLGEDGHTASLFPDRLDLVDSKNICEAVMHPKTGQGRITLTFPVINNANRVIFLVTGQNKARVVEKILDELPGSEMYPAKYVKPVYGSLVWYLDEDARRFRG